MLRPGPGAPGRRKRSGNGRTRSVARIETGDAAAPVRREVAP